MSYVHVVIKAGIEPVAADRVMNKLLEVILCAADCRHGVYVVAVGENEAEAVKMAHLAVDAVQHQ